MAALRGHVHEESGLLRAHHILWALHASLAILGKLDVDLSIVRYSPFLHITEVIGCLAGCCRPTNIRVFAIEKPCDFLQGYALYSVSARWTTDS